MSTSCECSRKLYFYEDIFIIKYFNICIVCLNNKLCKCARAAIFVYCLQHKLVVLQSARIRQALDKIVLCIDNDQAVIHYVVVRFYLIFFAE